MLDFNFYNPTRIIFGKERIKELADFIPKNKRILILYGGGSAEKTGTLAEVRKSLEGFTFFEFGGIEANPEYETLLKAVKQIKTQQIDFLLAVGGGSVIDGTKFIAAAVDYEGDPWDILLTRGKNVKKAIPFGTVLTLPATGSEMNNGSVISRKELPSKRAFMSEFVFPQFSILDPTKTYTLPARQLANGIVDSFVHIMEQYLTYPADGMVQDKFSEGLLRILIEIAPKVMQEKPDYESRANFMWTATLALNELIGAGVPNDWTSHMIGHELTALFGIDHAQTLAVVLPAVMRNRKEDKREKLLQYAKEVWNITEGNNDERIEKAINKTIKFFESVGMKTKLSDHNITFEQANNVVKQLEKNGMVKLGERANITPEIVKNILQNCF